MRGKISAKVPRKARDWDDIVQTEFACWKLGRSAEGVLLMPPSQRKAVQAEAAALRLAEFNKRKSERDAAWAAWQLSSDPNRCVTWLGHCQSIGRPDLFRNEQLSDSRTGRLITADADYGT